jgi:hypothetical protein
MSLKSISDFLRKKKYQDTIVDPTQIINREERKIDINKKKMLTARKEMIKRLAELNNKIDQFEVNLSIRTRELNKGDEKSFKVFLPVLTELPDKIIKDIEILEKWITTKPKKTLKAA